MTAADPAATRCCNGTGFADYAAVPCPDPTCTATPEETGMDFDQASGWFAYWETTSGEEAQAAMILRAELDRRGERIAELEAIIRDGFKHHDSLRAEFEGTRSERDRLRSQRDAALALHPREEMGERVVCGWCRDSSEEPWEYPCPTVRALTEETDQ